MPETTQKIAAAKSIIMNELSHKLCRNCANRASRSCTNCNTGDINWQISPSMAEDLARRIVNLTGAKNEK